MIRAKPMMVKEMIRSQWQKSRGRADSVELGGSRENGEIGRVSQLSRSIWSGGVVCLARCFKR